MQLTSLFGFLTLTLLSKVQGGERFYTFKPLDIHGKPHDFDQYRDKIVLVVNVASQCGYTDQNYKELSRLYDQYNREGFEIVAFPCNQFGKQEPWPEPEINKWTKENYNVKFPMMSKVNVKGPETLPLFEYLKGEKSGEINWNFDGKYLIDRSGHVVERFTNDDDFRTIERNLNRLLHQDRRDRRDRERERGRPDRPDRPPRRERPDKRDRPPRPDRPDPRDFEKERERRRAERRERRERDRARREREREL